MGQKSHQLKTFGNHCFRSCRIPLHEKVISAVFCPELKVAATVGVSCPNRPFGNVSPEMDIFFAEGLVSLQP